MRIITPPNATILSGTSNPWSLLWNLLVIMQSLWRGECVLAPSARHCCQVLQGKSCRVKKGEKFSPGVTTAAAGAKVSHSSRLRFPMTRCEQSKMDVHVHRREETTTFSVTRELFYAVLRVCTMRA